MRNENFHVLRDNKTNDNMETEIFNMCVKTEELMQQKRLSKTKTIGPLSTVGVLTTKSNCEAGISPCARLHLVHI